MVLVTAEKIQNWLVTENVRVENLKRYVDNNPQFPEWVKSLDDVRKYTALRLADISDDILSNKPVENIEKDSPDAPDKIEPLQLLNRFFEKLDDPGLVEKYNNPIRMNVASKAELLSKISAAIMFIGGGVFVSAGPLGVEQYVFAGFLSMMGGFVGVYCSKTAQDFLKPPLHVPLNIETSKLIRILKAYKYEDNSDPQEKMEFGGAMALANEKWAVWSQTKDEIQELSQAYSVARNELPIHEEITERFNKIDEFGQLELPDNWNGLLPSALLCEMDRAIAGLEQERILNSSSEARRELEEIRSARAEIKEANIYVEQLTNTAENITRRETVRSLEAEHQITVDPEVAAAANRKKAMLNIRSRLTQ